MIRRVTSRSLKSRFLDDVFWFGILCVQLSFVNDVACLLDSTLHDEMCCVARYFVALIHSLIHSYDETEIVDTRSRERLSVSEKTEQKFGEAHSSFECRKQADVAISAQVFSTVRCA